MPPAPSVAWVALCRRSPLAPLDSSEDDVLPSICRSREVRGWRSPGWRRVGGCLWRLWASRRMMPCRRCVRGRLSATGASGRLSETLLFQW